MKGLEASPVCTVCVCARYTGNMGQPFIPFMDYPLYNPRWVLPPVGSRDEAKPEIHPLREVNHAQKHRL